MSRIAKVMESTSGVITRVLELRENPLLSDIYVDMKDAGKYRSARPKAIAGAITRRSGIKRDKANFLRDKRNMAKDLRAACAAAKAEFGA
ncbi:MAG: hypothetical protein FWC26_13925 [Fibromonadales bacterium]|nr:hypothetical protein [Fibromonadales bacterium]